MDKSAVFSLIKSHHGISKQQLQRRLDINPNNEEDRKAVWQLASHLATLIRFSFVEAESGIYFAKAS